MLKTAISLALKHITQQGCCLFRKRRLDTWATAPDSKLVQISKDEQQRNVQLRSPLALDVKAPGQSLGED